MKTPALISSSTFLAFVNAHEKKKGNMRKKGKEKKRRREKVSEKKKRVHDMLIQDFPTVSPFFLYLLRLVSLSQIPSSLFQFQLVY